MDVECEHRSLKTGGHLFTSIGVTKNPWRMFLVVFLEFLEVGRCFLHADVESANALCVRVLVRTFCLHVTFSLV